MKDDDFISIPKFSFGEVIHHKLFEYRGVIFKVDPKFAGSEKWYQEVALSRPPKDRPWYHVLVHQNGQTTYVAERNLELDESGGPIEHPLLDQVFTKFEDGKYHRIIS